MGKYSKKGKKIKPLKYLGELGIDLAADTWDLAYADTWRLHGPEMIANYRTNLPRAVAGKRDLIIGKLTAWYRHLSTIFVPRVRQIWAENKHRIAEYIAEYARQIGKEELERMLHVV